MLISKRLTGLDDKRARYFPVVYKLNDFEHYFTLSVYAIDEDDMRKALEDKFPHIARITIREYIGR